MYLSKPLSVQHQKNPNVNGGLWLIKKKKKTVAGTYSPLPHVPSATPLPSFMPPLARRAQ